MNRYSVVIWVNGSTVIHSEHENAEDATEEYFLYTGSVVAEAKTKDEYHATIKVLNNQLDNLNGLVYTINKTKPVEKPVENSAGTVAG